MGLVARTVAGAVAAAAAVGALAAGPATAHPTDTCVAPPGVVSGAPCLFDIWGYVRDSSGAPLAGVIVTDGHKFERSDADGRYQMQHMEPGSYTITARRGPVAAACEVSAAVEHQVTDAWVLGTQHDFAIPC